MNATDADGQPIPLRDELLFFLEHPPKGTGDRWQEGADLCASHGIQTSRMSVWRFYNAQILEWRREQAPVPPVQPPDPAETARLLEQARHLAAQRALDMLNDPGLTPGHLVGLMQSDNHRQQIQLARDQFNDRVAERRRLQEREHFQNIDDRVRDEVISAARLEFIQSMLDRPSAGSSHTTP